MNIPVFRNGVWISYLVPTDLERYWSHKLKLQAASVYATAITKGYSKQESASLAEAWVNKQLYEGLTYGTQLEDKLKSFLV